MNETVSHTDFGLIAKAIAKPTTGTRTGPNQLICTQSEVVKRICQHIQPLSEMRHEVKLGLHERVQRFIPGREFDDVRHAEWCPIPHSTQMFRSFTPVSRRYTGYRRARPSTRRSRSRSRRGIGYAAGQNAGTSFLQVRLEDTIAITLSPVAGQQRNWGGRTINIYQYLAESEMFRVLAKLYDQVRITGATVWVNQLTSGVQTTSNTASQLVCSWDRNSTGFTTVTTSTGDTRQVYIDPKPPAAQGYQSSSSLPLGNLDSPKRYRFFIDARSSQETTTYLSTEELINRADTYSMPSMVYNQWNPALILGVDLRGLEPGNVLTTYFKLEISISIYLRGFRFDPTIGTAFKPDPAASNWMYSMMIADIGEYVNGDRNFPVPAGQRFLKSFVTSAGAVQADWPYIATPLMHGSHS